MIVVNGRFMARKTTGVERVGASICRLLCDAGDVELIMPNVRTPVTGHLWEQLILPIRARGHVLWSPANSGPLLHRRQLLTLYDASVWDHPEWFAPSYASWFRALVPRLARHVAAVMTVSEFSSQRIRTHTGIPANKISVIPLATETLESQNAGAQPLGRGGALPEGLNPGSFVLTVGTLEPRKNLAGLLRAWKDIKSSRGQVQLVVVGGSQSAALRQVCISSDDSVIVLGHVHDETLVLLYRSCLAFAFASLYEGFGLPPVEAAAYGCRVLTSDLPPIREVLGAGPIYVNPNSVASMADGLRALLADTAEGRVVRLPKRTWAEVAREVHDSLRSL